VRPGLLENHSNLNIKKWVGTNKQNGIPMGQELLNYWITANKMDFFDCPIAYLSFQEAF
jgi:hypothetical protein